MWGEEGILTGGWGACGIGRGTSEDWDGCSMDCAGMPGDDNGETIFRAYSDMNVGDRTDRD